jgi:hypothetical protein
MNPSKSMARITCNSARTTGSSDTLLPTVIGSAPLQGSTRPYHLSDYSIVPELPETIAEEVIPINDKDSHHSDHSDQPDQSDQSKDSDSDTEVPSLA